MPDDFDMKKFAEALYPNLVLYDPEDLEADANADAWEQAAAMIHEWLQPSVPDGKIH